MSTITDAELAEWDAQRGDGMVSAVGEYTPPEFWLLLDEVRRLRGMLETNRCGRGHVTLPLVLWDCPECHEITRLRLVNLIAADDECDAAADELAEAKRATGNWRTNPLSHTHPAVLRMRAAKAGRKDALDAAKAPR